jgi:flagellin-like hook-associated protein FlgL
MGSSAISLSAAMQSNLLSLQNINTQIQTAQTDLATGKSVNSAADNATAYFEAQSGYTEASQLNNLKDAMGQGLQVVTTALTAITSATTILQQMQGLAQQAEATTNTTTIGNLQTQYNQLQAQLTQITQNDANYQGTNLLSGTAGNNLTINFNADGTSNITISATDTTSTTYTPAAATSWASSASNIQASQTASSDAVTAYNSLSQTLGSYSALITTRQNFTTQLSNIFTTGANNLTNADLNQESANLLALQTQQQLGISALSLANQANQSVLRLFQ